MRARAAFASWVLLVLALLDLATPGDAYAAAAKLTGGTVAPTTGTTATAFLFSVHFVGSATDEAVTVGASVAGGTVPLSLFSGTARNGTWTGSSTLPAGSWTVTYQSTSTGLTNPTFVAPGQVVVTPPTPAPTPSPTPAPTPGPTATPRPTPVPTPRPTAVPATATPVPGGSLSPGVSPTPLATTVTNPSGMPTDAESALSSRIPDGPPTPSASPAAAPGSSPFSIPLEGMVAIGLLGAVTVAAALGERRRRLAVEAFRAAKASPADTSPSETEGPAGGWEHDAVDDETVATIDYQTPDDPADPPNL